MPEHAHVGQRIRLQAQAVVVRLSPDDRLGARIEQHGMAGHGRTVDLTGVYAVPYSTEQDDRIIAQVFASVNQAQVDDWSPEDRARAEELCRLYTDRATWVDLPYTYKRARRACPACRGEGHVPDGSPDGATECDCVEPKPEYAHMFQSDEAPF